MIRFPRRIVAASGLILAIAAAVSGCSSSSGSNAQSSSSSGSSGSSGGSNVSVGYLQIADDASFFMADNQGYFSQNNLTVTPKVFSAGTAVIPALQSGSLNIGFVAVLSALQATEQGVQGQCIAGSHVQPKPDSTTELLVAPSEAKTTTNGKDLNGKKVAVNSLGNIMQLQASNWIQAGGGDPSTVNWVVMGFADMPAALAKGTVDAAMVVEPAITMGKKAGIPVLSARPGEAGGYADVNQSCWFAMDSWINSHKTQATEFATAIQQGANYFEQNPNTLRSILPKWTGTTSALANEIILPQPQASLTTHDLQVWADGGLKFGLLHKQINLSSLIYSGNPANK